MVLHFRLTLLCASIGGTTAFWSSSCSSETQCKEQIDSLKVSLEDVNKLIQRKKLTVNALDYLRSGILSGERVPLPSHQRQYMDRGNALVSAVTLDAKHRPLTSNVSQHMIPTGTIPAKEPLRHFGFLPLKKPSGGRGAASRPSVLIIAVTATQKLVVYNISGDVILEPFDLGHTQSVTMMQLSPNQENHFIMTADEGGLVRVHDLQVVNQKLEGEAANGTKKSGSKAPEERKLVIRVNQTSSFRLPKSIITGEERELTAILSVERGSQTFYLAGDHLGGISVIFKNGTLKGRVKVTNFTGGVRGLIRQQGQNVLYYSSNEFGFFSTAQIDVQYQPCTGWDAPLYMALADPAYSTSRVILALTNGDVLVFSTQRGKAKACDLSLKFPRVAPSALQLKIFRGHAVALSMGNELERGTAERQRELFFLNLGAMEHGYGAGTSRAVVMQVPFERPPSSFALYTSGGSDRSKAQLAILPQDGKDLWLYDINMKQAAAPKVQGEDADGGWFSWFPKIGVFGIALIGVVLWNVRKVTTQRRGGGGGGKEDFDMSDLNLGAMGKGLGKKGGLGGLGGRGKAKGGGGTPGLEGMEGLMAGLGGLGGDDDDDD